MKKWTEEFLKRKPKLPFNSESTLSNASKAEKKIRFPEGLWMELAHEWSNSRMRETKCLDTATAFAAGMAVGWAEHEESVK